MILTNQIPAKKTECLQSALEMLCPFKSISHETIFVKHLIVFVPELLTCFSSPFVPARINFIMFSCGFHMFYNVAIHDPAENIFDITLVVPDEIFRSA